MTRGDRPVTRVECTEHPGVELVVTTSWRLPVDRQGKVLHCPDLGHKYRGHAHRCAWCGGPVGGRRAYMAAYCGTAHRVAAHRARQAVTRVERDGPAR